MILYITRKFPPSIGGMQRFNFKLSTHLHKLTPVYLVKWGGDQWILPFFLPFAFLAGLWACLTKDIRCIYVSDGVLSPLGYLLKLVTRKPTAANIHGRDIAYQLPIYQMVIPWCLRRLDKVICVSHELKNQCLKRNVPEEILHVIPNGVDVEDFTSKDIHIAQDALAAFVGKDIVNKKILITVGRLVAKKGVDSFLLNIFPRILEKNPNVLYLIIGDGPLLNKSRKIIKDQNMETQALLLGRVSMDDGPLAAIYQSADVFVMPNVPVADDMEGFGIVALEAGAAGLPVVASRVDGITEAVQDGENGFLIDYNDYQSFAQKILDLLNNEEERRRCGQKAQAFIKDHYAWEAISKRYLDQFETLKASRQGEKKAHA